MNEGSGRTGADGAQRIKNSTTVAEWVSRQRDPASSRSNIQRKTSQLIVLADTLVAGRPGVRSFSER